MIPLLKYQNMNWVDGMKVSKDHFIALENALLDSIRDSYAFGIKDYNYGLLPPVMGEKTSLDIEILKTGGENLFVRLNSCRAITPGGCRIELTPNKIKSLNLKAQVESKFETGKFETGTYEVILKVNPFNRIPVGNPDPDEIPPRHPYSSFEHKLWVLPSEQVNPNDLGEYYLTLARINFKGGEWLIDNTFIPSCTSVNSSGILIGAYKTLGTQLGEIESSSLKIIQKIISKNQKAPLSENVKFLCERLSFLISQLFFTYKTVSYQVPPIFLCDIFVKVANNFRLVLMQMPEKEKEDMLNYFNEWTDIIPSSFEKMVSSVTDLDYDHNNIAASINPILQFVSLVASLMTKLSTLEFIGKHKEKDLFVRETRVDQDQSDKKKKPWRPMLD